MAAQDLTKLKAELTSLLNQKSSDFRAQNSDIKVHSFGCGVAPVSYTHLTLPTNREV